MEAVMKKNEKAKLDLNKDELNTEEAMQFLGISRNTLRKLVLEEKKIIPLGLTRNWKFLKSDLEVLKKVKREI